MKSVKTKLISAAALVILLIAALAGCAKTGTGNDPADLTLEDLVEKLYDNVDVPPYETVRLDSSNFEFFAFVPYDDSLSAVAADALVNITPHSVVVIRAENGNGASLAKKVVENADQNKWLCVGSEIVNVAYTDHYVLLIMSEKAIADDIAENFKNMAKDLDGMEMTLLTVNNSRYDQYI